MSTTTTIHCSLDDDHLYRLDLGDEPATLAKYAGARLEAQIDGDHDPVILLSQRQATELLGEWLAICSARGCERPEPFELGGRWAIVADGPEDLPVGHYALTVIVGPSETLGAAARRVEGQVLAQLFGLAGGNLDRVAEVLLGQPGAGRKVGLRLNQLGMRVGEMRDEMAMAEGREAYGGDEVES